MTFLLVSYSFITGLLKLETNIMKSLSDALNLNKWRLSIGFSVGLFRLLLSWLTKSHMWKSNGTTCFKGRVEIWSNFFIKQFCDFQSDRGEYCEPFCPKQFNVVCPFVLHVEKCLSVWMLAGWRSKNSKWINFWLGNTLHNIYRCLEKKTTFSQIWMCFYHEKYGSFSFWTLHYHLMLI